MDYSVFYKLAAEAILRKRLPLTPEQKKTVATLLKAKQESDRKNYREKHKILRSLLEDMHEEFLIDSESGSIVGLTHQPSNFKIHAPHKIIPQPMSIKRLKGL